LPIEERERLLRLPTTPGYYKPTIKETEILKKRAVDDKARKAEAERKSHEAPKPQPPPQQTVAFGFQRPMTEEERKISKRIWEASSITEEQREEWRQAGEANPEFRKAVVEGMEWKPSSKVDSAIEKIKEEQKKWNEMAEASWKDRKAGVEWKTDELSTYYQKTEDEKKYLSRKWMWEMEKILANILKCGERYDW
jgi:hypothetical protein